MPLIAHMAVSWTPPPQLQSLHLPLVKISRYPSMTPRTCGIASDPAENTQDAWVFLTHVILAVGTYVAFFHTPAVASQHVSDLGTCQLDPPEGHDTMIWESLIWSMESEMHVWEYGITTDVHVGLCSDYHVAACRTSAARNQKRHSFAPQQPYLHARLRNEDIPISETDSRNVAFILPAQPTTTTARLISMIPTVLITTICSDKDYRFWR
ncbi:hypothetical protein BJ166DRAFT_138464 [Pestalotiopsis sp. NC0098]|nr:hypothetical protein BJ166DRAFT_138464 [Pestalotiopsis sp. NC0098]